MTFVGALACVAGWLLVGATAAMADQNCDSKHCYSYAYTNGSWNAFYFTQQRSTSWISTATDSQAHINTEAWFSFPNGRWVEFGIRNGSDSLAVSGGCGCVAYDQFWADITPTGEDLHVIAHLSPNSLIRDSYQISPGSQTGYWDIYVDSSYINTSTLTGSGGSANIVDIGGEYQNTSCMASYGGQDTVNMQYEFRSSTTGAWSAPAPNGTPVDHANCGMNGTVVGSTSSLREWNWNLNDGYK